MSGAIVITGASGVVGKAVTDLLRRRECELILLSRGRMRGMTRCDLLQPALGLSGADLRRVRERASVVIHAAASTDFAASAAEATRANVATTESLMRFVATCPRVEKVVVVSTTHVAGRRTGVIREAELEHDSGFVNEYERSKYDMELMLRGWRGRLPIAIARCSTILADSDGKVARYEAIHRALALYHAGLVPLIPGTPASPVDLIPLDGAAERIAAIAGDAFEPRAFHVASGTSAPSLEALLALTESISEEDPEWRRKRVERPPIVPLETFERLERAVARSRDEFLGGVMRLMMTFVPQLAYPKTFETPEPVAPPFALWYAAFLRRAIRERFGRATLRP